MEQIKETRIFVLAFGWVLVGRGYHDIEEYVLEKSASIRIWGTKQGVFELANGPLKETVLDNSNSFLFINDKNILFSFVCSDTGWYEALK